MFFLIAAALTAALAIFWPVRAVNLASGVDGWTAQGCFQQGSVYPSTRYDKKISKHERRGVSLWGSYCGSDSSTGELRSPVFQAPPILELFIAGYVGRPGLEIFLERENDHTRVALPWRDAPGEHWTRVRWQMDASTSGQPVRLVAIDRATALAGWLGVSNPRRLSLFSFYRLQLASASLTIATYLWQLALFLLPGFAIASLLTSRRRSAITPIYLVIIVIVTGATLGYLSFWAFFFSHNVGKYLSFTAYIVSAVLLLMPSLTGKAAIQATARAIAEPILYTLLAGLCYVSFYFLFTDPLSPGVEWAGERFFTEIRPGDNVIPFIFAERIYSRLPIRPFCCGDWLSSDRPPLQTGIVLMERPLRAPVSAALNYELLSSALQCFWICGVWCLLTSLATPRSRIRQVLGFLIFSGFLFYNSVYTWPKLLSAACVLLLLSILFELVRANRTMKCFDTVLVAACLGLLLMAHPGSTFSLPVFGLLFIRFRRLFPLRQVALLLSIVVASYLPWSAYQRFVDPPGNRLLKMHLGGIIPVDSRSTWEGIRDSYHAHSWQELLRYKWSNVVMLAGLKVFDCYGLTAFQGGHIDLAATENSRTVQRLYMWNAVGLVNAGWLAGLFLLIKNGLLKGRSGHLAIPFSNWLLSAAFVNLLFWCAVTFGPYETVTAHSSYADLLLLSVGLLSFVLTLPRIWFLLLLGCQLFNFFAVWVYSLPARISQPVIIQLPMLFLGLALTVVLVWLTVRPAQERIA